MSRCPGTEGCNGVRVVQAECRYLRWQRNVVANPSGIKNWKHLTGSVLALWSPDMHAIVVATHDVHRYTQRVELMEMKKVRPTDTHYQSLYLSSSLPLR